MSSSSFSQFIKSDLKNKLIDNHLKTPLTLTALAKHYQVSTRPIRQAIDVLIQEQVIQKQANGRLAPHPQLQRKNLKKDKISAPVDHLKKVGDFLLQESIKGGPEFVREIDTAEHFGISQTQIRQIFSTLNGQGLLQHIPRHGWKLRRFTNKDLIDYSEAREAMELKALELSWKRLEPQLIEKMLEGNFIDRDKSQVHTNNDMHDYFIEKSDNHYIQDFFKRHSAYFQMLFTYELKVTRHPEATCHQHQQILTNILKNSLPKAKKSLSEHILFNHEELKKSLLK